jgi:hypothetical protein
MTGPYCSACGQKEPPLNPSVWELVKEGLHEFTHLDGKTIATLRTLFSSPGRLTLDFLAGRRRRWLSPLRLYIICSLVFFASRPIIEGLTGRSLRQTANVTLREDGSAGPLTALERQQLAEGLPGRLFGVERLERAAMDQATLNRELEAAFPRAMFVLMPIFALLTRVLWRGTGLRYPAHLYLSLGLHSAVFAVFSLLTIVRGLIPSDGVVSVLSLAALGYLGAHFLIALRRVFTQSWTRTILKSVLVGIVYVMLLLTTGMLLLGYAVSQM